MTTTSKKVRSTSKKSVSRVNVSASELAQVVNVASGVASPAGAGVGASGASDTIGISSVVSGVASSGSEGAKPALYNKVRQTSASQLENAVTMETINELKLIEFRQKVASNWAAPEWSGASALRALLVSYGLKEDQINAAVSGAARKSGEDLTAVTPSVSEVVEYIRNNYDSEFRSLCGCSVPAAADVRLYSLTSLSVSTITEDSNVGDYVSCAAVPAGASASAVVAAVCSVRFLTDIRKRIAAARAAGRADLRACAANLVRRASRLGVSAEVLGRYLSVLAVAVPAADNKEEKRLRANLARCWSNLRTLENDIVLTGGTFGAIEDGDGGWCFPAALPASAPAKVRKMWAKRVRLLSAVHTLETLLARC